MNTIEDIKTYSDFVKYWNAEPILCNEIRKHFEQLELEQGELEDEEGNNIDIFQWYIVSDSFADMIKRFTDEIVFYHNELNIYIWGVTHFGTSWDGVDIELKLDK